jgi:nucleoside-diphosphate-sugar epimerase
MTNSKPAILVTGVSGNLGLRLLPELADYDVIGVDLTPPQTNLPVRFLRMDLGEEDSCRELMLLLRDSHVAAVVHLAFVLDPVRNGILDVDRMWRINVAGTARLLEAVGETNRYEAVVRKVIVPSSVTVYGPDLPEPVKEEAPFGAHTLPYAVHKMEVEKVIQQRSPGLRGCSVYSLRSHIFAGSTMDNYILGAFRGTPNGHGKRAAEMRRKGTRLPCLLPMGKRYLENRMQFVHVDDVARLISYVLRRTEPEPQRLTVLNVAGRGAPLTLARCLEIARARAVRLPGNAAFRLALRVVWDLGISATPPQAAPYITGEYLMNTQRLREFLGADYERVIRYTVEEAFEDSFASVAAVPVAAYENRSESHS